MAALAAPDLYGARMSQPVDPYRGEPGHPYRQPHGGQHHAAQPYGGQSYGGQPYGVQPHGGQVQGRQAYGEQPYGEPASQRAYAPHVQHEQRPRPVARRSWRLPGLGLLLVLLGLVVQVLSFTVLPWLRLGAGGEGATPTMRQLASDLGTGDFGGLYVALLSYPLAALAVVLALASVLESVALKIIWAGLAVIGLGILVVRYGVGPLAADGLDFGTLEVVIAMVAAGALVVVVFMLRTAVSMFRRIAGLILLGITGVHVAAIMDLAGDTGAEQLTIGAYGPALGYLLTATAAFVGPRGLRL